MIKRILLVILKRVNFLFGDKTFIKLRYRLEMGKGLDLKHPKTMNEKLQWLKLNNRYPLLTDIVDKIKVKRIVAEKIGKEHVIPTYRVWNSPEDISEVDFANMPDKFVIKTNHSGGNTGVIICDRNTDFNLAQIKEKMARSMKSDIFSIFREWPYKNVKRQIFAERHMGDNLVDYKFFCFNGEVDSVMLCIDRNIPGKKRFYFFDRDWKLRRYNYTGKNAPEDFTVPKPEGMDEMFEMAAKLSEGFPFVRVDLYNVEGKIYFGELTFFPASGFDANLLPEADLYWGEKINLSLARKE